MDQISASIIKESRHCSHNHQEAVQMLAIESFKSLQDVFIYAPLIKKRETILKGKDSRLVKLSNMETERKEDGGDICFLSNMFKLANPSVREILRLVLDGYSIRGIAEKHNVSKTLITKRIKSFSKRKEVVALKEDLEGEYV